LCVVYAGALVERAHTTIHQKRRISRRIEESPIEKARQNQALHQQYRAFDLGFVARMRWAGGQHGAAVVGGDRAATASAISLKRRPRSR